MLTPIKDISMILFLKSVKLLKTTNQLKDKTTTKSTVYLRLKILQFKRYSILGRVFLLAGCNSSSREYKMVNYVSDCLFMSRDRECLSSFVSTLPRIQSEAQTEMAPTVHLALTLPLQEQSVFFCLIHCLNRENTEKERASDPA